MLLTEDVAEGEEEELKEDKIQVLDEGGMEVFNPSIHQQELKEVMALL
jgi:hypothetical protein